MRGGSGSKRLAWAQALVAEGRAGRGQPLAFALCVCFFVLDSCFFFALVGFLLVPIYSMLSGSGCFCLVL